MQRVSAEEFLAGGKRSVGALQQFNQMQYMHRLPLEILSSILLLVPCDGCKRQDEDSNSRRFPASDVDHIKCLMGVCSHWRNLVRSTPYFWTKIYRMDDRNVWRYKLQNSAALPLDIYAGEESYNGPGSLDEFINLITPERYRWRSMELVAPLTILNWILRCIDSGAPMLEALRLRTQYRTSAFPGPFTLNNLPNLKLLSFDRIVTCPSSHTSCPNLEHLYLSYASFSDQRTLAELLEICSRLVLLDLVAPVCPPDYNRFKGNAVTLTELKLLRLFTPLPRRWDIEFLPILHTPALQKIVFDTVPGIQGSAVDANVITGFPDGSGIPTVTDAPLPSVLRNTGATFAAAGLSDAISVFTAWMTSAERDQSGTSILESIEHEHHLTGNAVVHYCCDFQPTLVPSSIRVKLTISFRDGQDPTEAHVLHSLRMLPGTTEITLLCDNDPRESRFLFQGLATPTLCPGIEVIRLDVLYCDDEDGYNGCAEVLEELLRLRGLRPPASGLSVLMIRDEVETDLETIPLP